MRVIDERALLEGVLGGDPAAGRAFVERYGPYLRVCVYRTFARLRSSASQHDVEDMVGDLWVSLFEDQLRLLRLYDPARSSLALWLGIIARNKTIDRIRTTPAPPTAVDDVAERPGEELSPTTTLEQQEQWALLRQALKRLSDSDRRFLEAIYLHDCPPEQLARQLGIRVVSVYTRRTKIQGKLTRQIRRLAAERLARTWRTRQLAVRQVGVRQVGCHQ